MYDLNKRSYISTLGELRMLLADLPDETEISGAGAFGAWLHFTNDEHLVCIDPEPLFDCYEEEDEEAEEEQCKAHEQRLDYMDESIQYFFVGKNLMRTFLADDGSWDYELYEVNIPNMRIADSGQLGENRDITRDEAINKVLSWNNLNKEKRYPIPVEALRKIDPYLE